MLAGPGRVRLRVDVQTHAGARLAVGGAGLELATVGHHDGDLVVVGMDVFLHGFDPLERRAVYPRRPAGASPGTPCGVAAAAARGTGKIAERQPFPPLAAVFAIIAVSVMDVATAAPRRGLQVRQAACEALSSASRRASPPPMGFAFSCG